MINTINILYVMLVLLLLFGQGGAFTQNCPGIIINIDSDGSIIEVKQQSTLESMGANEVMVCEVITDSITIMMDTSIVTAAYSDYSLIDVLRSIVNV
jgi:hypothetical protein